MRRIKNRRRNLGRIALDIDQQGQLVKYVYYRFSPFERVQGEQYWRLFRREFHSSNNF